MPRSRIFSESIRKHSLIRRFSDLADKNVEAAIGAKVGPGMAALFILNSLTGLPLLTLPHGFNQAGILLGSIVLATCMLVSFVTATFMCEALTIANALAYEEAEAVTVKGNPEVFDHLHKVKEKRLSEEDEEPLHQPLLTGTKSADTLDMFLCENRKRLSVHEFKIRERVELGAMGELVLRGDWGWMQTQLIYIAVLTYTYGAVAAFVVTANKSLASAACSSFSLAEASERCSEDSMLLIYKGCVVATFFVSMPLCFANLQKTKKFTLGIMVMRFIAIACMLAISSSVAARRLHEEGLNAVAAQMPLWNSDAFTAVFGNAVLMFCIHHNVPSMIAPLEPQLLAPRVVKIAFIICYFLSIAVCGTAMVAWDAERYEYCSRHPGGHFCQIQPIYNLNFAPLSWGRGVFSLFIVMYPATLIASIPIPAITTRNTLGRLLGIPPADPDKPYTLKNVLLTCSVLFPACAVAFFTQNVQAVVQYFAGYAGLTVALLCPWMLVRCGRVQLARRINDRNEAPQGIDEQVTALATEDPDRPLISNFATPLVYCAVVVYYMVSLAFVTRKLFLQ